MRKALVVALVVAGAAGVAAVAHAQIQGPHRGEMHRGEARGNEMQMGDMQMGEMQGHRGMGMTMHHQMHDGRAMHEGEQHGMDKQAAPAATPAP